MSTIYSNQNSRILFEKCRNKENDKAMEMIENKEQYRININERFEGGCTSFFISCFHGSLKLVKALFDSGADITLESDNISPFTVACVKGNITIVDYLLSEHSDKVEANTIITGLVAATQYGFPQIIRRILDTSGIDINLSIDDQGATLLYVAVETQHEIIVSLLLSLGADTNKSRSGYYPIHIASQNGDLKILESLLKHDADPDVMGPDGATSLLIAAQNGNVQVIDLLYRFNADPNLKMKTDGSSPLYVAAARHHKNTVNALIENPKLDINLQLTDGTSTLHVLSQFGYQDTLENIYNKFSSTIQTDIKKKDGSTPLHLAARHGQFKVCSLLIEHGADITIECDGDTALSISKRYGRTDTINILQQAFDNLNK